jgi:hypothetical protein
LSQKQNKTKWTNKQTNNKTIGNGIEAGALCINLSPVTKCCPVRLGQTKDFTRKSEAILVLCCLPETDGKTPGAILFWVVQQGDEKVDTVCSLCFASVNQSFVWV